MAKSVTKPKSSLAFPKTEPLKSCLNTGTVRGHFSVTLKNEPSYGKSKLGQSAGRRGSFEKLKRFSIDSLDNSRRNSWDAGRRGSTGSSGGWDDPIWEDKLFRKSFEVKRWWEY